MKLENTFTNIMAKSALKNHEDSVSDISDNESVASSSPSEDAGSNDSDSGEDTSAHQKRPLKRRRGSDASLLLPDDDEEEDEEEELPPARPLVQTTSRIKKKVDTQQATQEQTTEPEPVTVMEALNAGMSSGNAASTFASIGLSPWLVRSLSNMAITRPTAIQKACIPEILKGRDCIGGSRTGSGKTIAFATPILQKWAQDPFGIYAVVLTPTRYVCVES